MLLDHVKNKSLHWVEPSFGSKSPVLAYGCEGAKEILEKPVKKDTSPNHYDPFHFTYIIEDFSWMSKVYTHHQNLEIYNLFNRCEYESYNFVER